MNEIKRISKIGRMCRWTLAVLAMALLCWSCVDEETAAPAAQQPDGHYLFTIAADEQPWQGQTVDITRVGETLLALKTNGFGLFSANLELTNQEVSWKENVWDYGSKLLWPNNRIPKIGDVDFRAYAPYGGYTLTDNKITFSSSGFDNTTDLLWAKPTSISSKGTVTLNFKHELGKLSFGHITNNYGRDITLKSITITDRSTQRLYKSGKLSLADGTWTDEYAYKSEQTITKDDFAPEKEGKQSLTVINDHSVNLDVGDIMQIPGPTVDITFLFHTDEFGDETVKCSAQFEKGVNKTVSVTIGMNHEVVIK